MVSKSSKTAQGFQAALDLDLRPLGLAVFGWFVFSDPPFTGRAAALIGNRMVDGRHRMWPVFSASAEASDGLADPLDRWTKRVIDPIAAGFDAAVLYPFGTPVWPFQRYAKAATAMRASPLGMLIHPEYGLWQAFRAVLIMPESLALDVPASLAHPCDSCEAKPCLAACPVDAFSMEGFDVAECRGHLSGGNDPDCMALGCQARAACPVGVPYPEAQIRFHMRAFGKSVSGGEA